MSKIKCPNCGAINSDKIAINKYRCPYCDHEYIIDLGKSDIVDVVKDGAKSASKGLLRLIMLYLSLNLPFVGIACYYSKQFFDHGNKLYLYASIVNISLLIIIFLVACLV